MPVIETQVEAVVLDEAPKGPHVCIGFTVPTKYMHPHAEASAKLGDISLVLCPTVAARNRLMRLTEEHWKWQGKDGGLLVGVQFEVEGEGEGGACTAAYERVIQEVAKGVVEDEKERDK